MNDGFRTKAAFLDEMLTDPMICLVMQADGVSEADIRGYYAKDAGNFSAMSGTEPDTRRSSELRLARPGIGE